MEYVYEDPTERGYKRLIVSRKQHNKIFPHRKIKLWQKPFVCSHYYFRPSEETEGEEVCFIVEHGHITILGKIAIMLTFPFAVFLYGLANYKETWRAHKDYLFQKKYGSFVLDHIRKGSKTEEEIMKVLLADHFLGL